MLIKTSFESDYIQHIFEHYKIPSLYGYSGLIWRCVYIDGPTHPVCVCMHACVSLRLSASACASQWAWTQPGRSLCRGGRPQASSPAHCSSLCWPRFSSPWASKCLSFSGYDTRAGMRSGHPAPSECPPPTLPAWNPEAWAAALLLDVKATLLAKSTTLHLPH